MSEKISEAELDIFYGERQLRVTLQGPDGVRYAFLPVPYLRQVGELAEDARSFAQELAPRRGRPPKGRVKVGKDSGAGGAK